MKSLQALMDLSGRVALVTGGAGYIGAAIGETLAELGAAVVVLDRQLAHSRRVSAHLRRAYRVDTLPLEVDLSQQEQVISVPEQVQAQFGRLDILVNNAAFVGTADLDGWVVPFIEQSPATWRAALEVNLTAPFILSQICTPALQASGHGVIVNIASIYGLVGPDLRVYGQTEMGNPAAYAASKGGLLQLTRWLATVLAPNVRVNAITPGGVLRGQDEAFQAEYVARTPLQRMATEEDLKGALAYLASDLSSYVTGQNLIVDGGWTAW